MKLVDGKFRVYELNLFYLISNFEKSLDFDLRFFGE